MDARSSSLSLLLALLAGCGSDALVVEVGTGQLQFEQIVPDSQIPIVCGPQGGQHIWVSIRARNLNPHSVAMRVAITSIEPQRVLCGQRSPDTSLFPNAGWAELTGITCFVTDPASVRGQPVVLSGSVTDDRGRTAGAEVRFVPFGPSMSCPRGGGTSNDGGLAAGDGGPTTDGG